MTSFGSFRVVPFRIAFIYQKTSRSNRNHFQPKTPPFPDDRSLVEMCESFELDGKRDSLAVDDKGCITEAIAETTTSLDS